MGRPPRLPVEGEVTLTGKVLLSMHTRGKRPLRCGWCWIYSKDGKRVPLYVVETRAPGTVVICEACAKYVGVRAIRSGS